MPSAALGDPALDFRGRRGVHDLYIQKHSWAESARSRKEARLRVLAGSEVDADSIGLHRSTRAVGAASPVGSSRALDQMKAGVVVVEVELPVCAERLQVEDKAGLQVQPDGQSGVLASGNLTWEVMGSCALQAAQG